MISGLRAETAAPNVEAFRKGLEEHGYRDGRDAIVEWRYTEGFEERAAEFANEFLKAGVAIIVTGNPSGVRAARSASTSVPIVMAGVGRDPVAEGFVASLAHPGANVTGLSLGAPGLSSRRLQLLKEILPGLVRIGVLHDGSLGDPAPVITGLEAAARSLGMELRVAVAKSVPEIEAAIPALKRDGAAALDVNIGTLFGANLARVTALALQHGLPSTSGLVEHARAGGLFALGVDQADTWRRSAGYVDKILKGAKPGDLPVEQPSKFELAINLKTAEALGLKIPQSVLSQATTIIR